MRMASRPRLPWVARGCACRLISRTQPRCARGCDAPCWLGNGQISIMRLTDFGVLTFDCYGTLIDWESGIASGLQPLLMRAGQTLTRDVVLAKFGELETQLERAHPATRYS